jgi:ferritin-like metal-binding protein YciE
VDDLLIHGLSSSIKRPTAIWARVWKITSRKRHEPQGINCPGIDGLIAEADDVAGEVADKQVLDAAIVGDAQSVEHYEIARYGT